MNLSKGERETLALIDRAASWSLTPKEKQILKGKNVEMRGLTQTEAARLQRRCIGAIGKDFQALTAEGFIQQTLKLVGPHRRALEIQLGAELGFGNKNPYTTNAKAWRFFRIESLKSKLDGLVDHQGDGTLEERLETILRREIDVGAKSRLAAEAWLDTLDEGYAPAACYLWSVLVVEVAGGTIAALFWFNSRWWRNLGAISRAHRSFIESKEFRGKSLCHLGHDPWSWFKIETDVLIEHSRQCLGCALS